MNAVPNGAARGSYFHRIPRVPQGMLTFEVIIMQNKPKKQRPTKGRPRRAEKPISDVYPVIDNDLARDNVENDLPAADREDLR